MSRLLRRRRHGVMLLEMLGVIILFTAFALVSAKLFTSLIRQLRDTNAAQDVAASFDAAVARLRADVWLAERVQSDGGTLVVTSGGRTITWSVAPPGTLARTEAASPADVTTSRWATGTRDISLSADRASVTLKLTPKSGIPDAVTFLAEGVTLKGGRP
jgi:hypothetical protein